MSHQLGATKPPFIVTILGYGGAIPFLALAAALCFDVSVSGVSLAQALLSYGAVILSFVGALHWGVVMARHGEIMPRSALIYYSWSVMPALIAWAALLLPDKRLGATVMALCFVACWRIDMHVIKTALWPVWMARLRLHLTSCAVASLAVIVLLPHEVA